MVGKKLLLLLVVYICYTGCNTQTQGYEISFTVRNTNYLAHGIVDLQDIGQYQKPNSYGLACRVNICCAHPRSSHSIRDEECTCSNVTINWYHPNGAVTRGIDTSDGYRVRRLGNVLFLYRQPKTNTHAHQGVWRCLVNDTIGVEQNSYIGAYLRGTGGMIETSQNYLNYSINEGSTFNLTLVTSGGPVTYFSWLKDGHRIAGHGNRNIDNTYCATRMVTQSQNSEYRNILTVTRGLAGVYKIRVRNNRTITTIERNITILDLPSPTNISITRNGVHSLRVSWKVPVTSPGLTGYRVSNNNCTRPSTMPSVSECKVVCIQDSTNCNVEVNATTTFVEYHNITLRTVYNISITVSSSYVDRNNPVPGYYYFPPLSDSSRVFSEVQIDDYNVATQLLSATSVNVTWSSNDQGLSPSEDMNQYFVRIQHVKFNGTDRDCETEDVNETHVGRNFIILNGLEEFSSYTVTITTQNEVEGSNVFTTYSAAPSGPPRNLTIIKMTTTSITITWESVECIHKNGPITHYIISYGPLNKSLEFNSTINVSDLHESDDIGFMHTLTSNIHIVPYQQYTFRVAAININGTGPYSDEIQTVKGVYAVFNVSIQPLNATSVMVTWTHTDQGLSVDKYIVSYQRINGTDGQCSTYQDVGMISVHKNTRSCTLIGLKEYSVYQISVTARNTPYNTTSEPISDECETPSAAPTGSPQNLTYSYHNETNTTNTSITITWESVECIERNGLITHYIINYEEIGGSIMESMNLTVNDTEDGGTFILTALESNKEFRVEVAAANEKGIGRFATLSITTATEQDSNTESDVSTPGSSTGFTVAPTLESDMSTTGSSTEFAVIAVVALALAITAVIIVAITVTMCRKRKKRILLKNSDADCDTNLSTNETNNLELLSQGTYINMYEPTLDKKASVAHTELPMIKKFPEDIHVTEGQEVILEVTVSGQPEPSLAWYHNGEELVANYSLEIDEDGRVYIPSSELRHNGVYKLVVKNDCGSDAREMNLYVHNEDEAEFTNQEEVDLSPVPVSEFGVFVAKHHEDFNAGFRAMYQGLYKGEDHTTKIGLSAANKKLNRFGNITVYDDNHIELKPDNGFDNTFVNACYVDGYGVPQKYIATQGPLPHTVSDFWRLVWQEKVPTIVMVTNLKEGEKEKCQQYWPDSGSQVYGPVEVTITDKQIMADYDIRTLFVKPVDISLVQQLKVTQYHFTSWPDHGVPTYATSMLAYYRRVKAEHKPKAKGGPMLVHCSAGVGRTGTFIAIDWVLEQVEKEKIVDIAGTVNKMRQQRMKMVQTVEQFMFIHDAILESVTCGNTQINVANLRSVVRKMENKDPTTNKTMFELHFDVLEQVASNSQQSMAYCATALRHPDKNRRMDYLPTENNRVILRGEFPDYIHATSVHGYREKNAYIIAEGPMKSTVRNFWKMICDRKCGAIIMLSDFVENGEESSFQYWPDNNEVRVFGDYTVEMTKELQFDGYTVRQLTTTMNMETSQCHQVTQFHITNWGVDGKCSDLSSISQVIDEVIRVRMRSGNKPIVVHCSDTVGRSGMFCAISSAIEQCKSEGVVDVFQIIKAMRVQKPGAVLNVEQYQLVYDAVLVFLDSFDMYANFQQII